MTYVVKWGEPKKEGTLKEFSCLINKSDEIKNIYDVIVFFEKNIFPNIKKEECENKSVDRILLRDIINIHDDDGIKDMKQISSMRNAIKQGKEVLSSSGVPNIQIVLTKEGEFLLFNGHHTMLAYMFEGKKYLDEVQHIIISDKDKVHASDDEISIFFGKHSGELINKNWRDFVINWQAAEDKQLCIRKQKSMGELFDVLSRDML